MITQSEVRKSVELMHHSVVSAARCLDAVRNRQLFQDWGYKTFSQYVREDLRMSYPRAVKLADIGEHSHRLGYRRDQIALACKYTSWHKLSMVLKGLDSFVSTGDLITMCNAVSYATLTHRRDVEQFNITLSSRYADKLVGILVDNGMGVDTDGKRHGVGSAFEALIDSLAPARRLRRAS